MNKPKNIKEFQALVDRYEKITFKEIEEAMEMKKDVTAKALTGFGSIFTCTLCVAVIDDKDEWTTDCEKCVYGGSTNCCKNENEASYNEICVAITAGQLFEAYRARAEYLRLTYPQYLKRRVNEPMGQARSRKPVGR